MTCEQRFERLEIASHVNFQAKVFNGGIIANAQTLSGHIMTYSRDFKYVEFMWGVVDRGEIQVMRPDREIGVRFCRVF